MPPELALPPGRFESPGAGLEPKKARLRRAGKPFRRDPAATKARFQTELLIYYGLPPKRANNQKK